jgi:hypothetical protein
MLVYGDRSEKVDPRLRLQDLGAELSAVASADPGLARHSTLADALIEGGRILQGVADADFGVSGFDRRTAATDALTQYLLAIGRDLCRSWDTGFAAELHLQAPPAALDLPVSIDMKVPEGYAFYALYPEAYAVTARSLQLAGAVTVIGLRSIGTSLAAVTAAALGASSFVTLRPFGDPYARRLSISDQLAGDLLSGNTGHFVIVDEGPGLSGSSFGAVADWLEDHGVAEDRILAISSHGGDLGSRASERHRERWPRMRRAVASFDDRFPELLSSWAGGSLRDLQDISHGQWRKRVYAVPVDWPPVCRAWERRKFIGEIGGRSCLVKFAGLGREGESKLERARILHAAGLAPEPFGLVHGFLIERWHDEAAPLPAKSKPLSRLAEYIATRAKMLPSVGRSGASLDQLLAMIRRNAALSLGAGALEQLESWPARLPRIDRLVVRTQTDNRLGRHEWLQLPGGRLLKSDAVDHCQAHDLIGCQDVAWDIAGAAIEFGLDDREASWLAAEVYRMLGRLSDPELLQFMTLAYLAFHLGHSTLSSEMAAGDPAERQRLEALAGRYRERLKASLQTDSQTATPQNSSLSAAAQSTPKGTNLYFFG